MYLMIMAKFTCIAYSGGNSFETMSEYSSQAKGKI